MDRETVAYGIILLMALSVVAVVFYLRRHSPERSYRRGEQRDNAAHKKRMAENEPPRKA